MKIKYEVFVIMNYEIWSDISCKYDPSSVSNRNNKRSSRLEAKANKLLGEDGKLAKPIKSFCGKDKKKHKKISEMRKQFGAPLWQHGIIGLSATGKPRGIKKATAAIPHADIYS